MDRSQHRHIDAHVLAMCRKALAQSRQLLEETAPLVEKFPAFAERRGKSM